MTAASGPSTSQAPDLRKADDPAQVSRVAWAALGVVYVVWGSTYLAIRVTVETVPPMTSAAIRFLCAGLLLAVVLSLRQGPKALAVTGRQLGSAALVGLMLLVGGNGLVVFAERSVPSGLAALLVAAVPLWVVLLRRATGHRTPAATLAGVLVGLVGLGVLTVPGLRGEVRLGGMLTVIGATVLWSSGSFLAARLPMPGNALVASVYEMLAGGLGALVLAAVRGELTGFEPSTVSTASWLALGYLVLFGSLLAFTAYAWLLQHAPLPLVATYAYVNPVVAVFLGWLILAEPLTWPVLLGGAIVVAGVCLVVRTER
ncbi:EamA family transporter [Kitasatospora sp. MMS16-BH015]|uniref:EamA family transporter n=1 Tax=Kitasatospora sp. MMS16-BH015 TaxID=2018025 RepID=UPI000CA1D92F|nr:EamA family transporter [Kitasatospora sp. MMS16-BH015]AUG80728.1 EamA family transporter [Kitasatospora sp. MMS16-BH015]